MGIGGRRGQAIGVTGVRGEDVDLISTDDSEPLTPRHWVAIGKGERGRGQGSEGFGRANGRACALVPRRAHTAMCARRRPRLWPTESPGPATNRQSQSTSFRLSTMSCKGPRLMCKIWNSRFVEASRENVRCVIKSECRGRGSDGRPRKRESPTKSRWRRRWRCIAHVGYGLEAPHP